MNTIREYLQSDVETLYSDTTIIDATNQSASEITEAVLNAPANQVVLIGEVLFKMHII